MQKKTLVEWVDVALLLSISLAGTGRAQQIVHLLSDSAITTAVFLTACDTSTFKILSSERSSLAIHPNPLNGKSCLLQLEKYYTELYVASKDTHLHLICAHPHQLLSDMLMLEGPAHTPQYLYFETRGPAKITIIHYISATAPVSMPQKLTCAKPVCRWMVSPSPTQYAITIIANNHTSQEIQEHTFANTCFDAIAGKSPDSLITIAEATMHLLTAGEAHQLHSILKANSPPIRLAEKLKEIWATRATCEEFLQFVERTFTAQKMFSSLNTPGHLSDRGRVYILYGPPNQILASSFEPGTLPYQIWHYYYLNGQPDVKFVFYNPEIAGANYTLIHSNLRGEINNPRWVDFVRQSFKSPEYHIERPQRTHPFWGERLPTYYRDY